MPSTYVMTVFIDGMILMASIVAALIFLRFWRRTDDRLFLLFSISFWMLAFNRLLLAFMGHGRTDDTEHQAALYILRLIAFVVILWAIIDKNRAKKRMPAQLTAKADERGGGG